MPTAICTFRVKPDSLDAFLGLLDAHWATMRRLELVTDTAEQQFVCVNRQGDDPVVVSIFEWINSEAVAIEAVLARITGTSSTGSADHSS